MAIWSMLVKPISEVVNNIIDKVAPDAGAAAAMKASFMSELLSANVKGLEAQTSVILAEANGDSWLQRNWRPVVMLWLMALISAYWFGLTPKGITEDIALSMFSLVKLGLGGYVVGRTGEKMMKEWKKK